jgi:hypothetical protein
MRIFVLLLATVATFYFVFWLPFWFLLPIGMSTAVRLVGAVSGALAVAWFLWKRKPGARLPGSLAGCVGKGAVATGVIGFTAGFVGPMIFAPSSNQGPLLGIFITGPLGLVLGAVGGGIYWMVRRRNAASGTSDRTLR